MTYQDADGLTWASILEAATTVRVRAGTIRVWAHRGRVRTKTAGRTVWVCLDDVQDCELTWRQRVRDTPART